MGMALLHFLKKTLNTFSRNL